MKKILILCFLFLSACSESDSGSGGAPYDPNYDTTPRNLVYQNQAMVLEHQIAITANYPTYYGSILTSFSISPALPQGLSFSTLSGRIAGTPEALVLTPQTYTITGTNSQGSTSATVTIQVKAQPPFGLVYPQNELIILKGVSAPVSLIPFVNLGIRGGAAITSFSISPSTLPDGISFDTTTGALEGIPSGGNFPRTVFTITGSNSGGSTSTEVALTIQTAATMIAAGGKHTCAIVDKKVKCWGDNVYGQLGSGNNTDSNTPVLVSSFTGRAQKIVVGSEFSCVGSDAGRSYCWGRNHQNQLGPGITGNTNVSMDTGLGIISDIDVSLSGYNSVSAKHHMCVRTIPSNEYKCVGEFAFGNLNAQSNFIKTNSTTNFAGLANLSSGGDFLCLIDNGAVKCLGGNSVGQLADNGASGSSSLYLIPSLLTSNINQLASGDKFACAQAGVEVRCWGANTRGQLGRASLLDSSSFAPVAVEGLTNDSIKNFLTAGRAHACVVDIIGSDNKVRCWGDNTYGQLGDGSAAGSFSRSPVNVLRPDGTELKDVQSLSAGEDHTCAITSTNEAFCWGRNDKGQLGNNTRVDSNKSVLVDSSIY